MARVLTFAIWALVPHILVVTLSKGTSVNGEMTAMDDISKAKKRLDLFRCEIKGIDMKGKKTKRSALRDQTKIWPTKWVTYIIDGSISDKGRAAIMDAIGEYGSKTGIVFLQKTDEVDDIKFVRGESCGSHVGRQNGEQELSIADHPVCESKGGVIHELMHALGFHHEHQRSDRDEHIDIKWENIVDGENYNFFKDEQGITDHLGFEYDYGSITHYGSHVFSKNGHPTIVPRQQGAQIGQLNRLSDGDVKKIMRLYGLDTCPDDPAMGFKKIADGRALSAPSCYSACQSALGMESGEIADDQLSASSSSSGWGTEYARLHGSYAWFPADYNDGTKDHWIQVDVGHHTRVTGIQTQGFDGWWNYWTKSYEVQYSKHGNSWSKVDDKVFTGNSDYDTVKRNVFSKPIITRYIRVVPKSWNNGIALRLELLGCKGCTATLGMESGDIKDDQMSASSFAQGWGPEYARLHHRYAWYPESDNSQQWIQVVMGIRTKVTAIQTQGDRYWFWSYWTKSYEVQYSDDGSMWRTVDNKIFEGNTNYYEVKGNHFSQPVVARCIRVVPKTWSDNGIALRLELLGCEGCVSALGMESGDIKEDQLSASSNAYFWGPKYARLNHQYAWYPSVFTDTNPWIQIDLRQHAEIGGIQTQGHHYTGIRHRYWIKSYEVNYSDDGNNWARVDGKEFPGNTNSYEVKETRFSRPVVARFIRVVPKSWYRRIALRLELLGCEAPLHGTAAESETPLDGASAESDIPLEGATVDSDTECSELYPTLQPSNMFSTYRKQCYWFSPKATKTSRLNYKAAQDECVSHGGSLVKIQDAGEQTFIEDYLKNTFGAALKMFWIGLDDLGDEGTLGAYDNFASGTNHPSRDCAVVWNIGRRGWSLVSCASKLPYICQMGGDGTN